MTPIGFLGLGNMGEVMALRLLRAGHADMIALFHAIERRDRA